MENPNILCNQKLFCDESSSRQIQRVISVTLVFISNLYRYAYEIYTPRILLLNAKNRVDTPVLRPMKNKFLAVNGNTVECDGET